jgi:hypothetical protein
MTPFGWRDVAWGAGAAMAAAVFGLSTAPLAYYVALWFKYWLG